MLSLEPRAYLESRRGKRQHRAGFGAATLLWWERVGTERSDRGGASRLTVGALDAREGSATDTATRPLLLSLCAYLDSRCGGQLDRAGLGRAALLCGGSGWDREERSGGMSRLALSALDA